MSDVVIDNQGGDTDDLKKDDQTVTIEQFEVMSAQLEESKKLFEDLKKAQSGSDSKVTELQNLLKQRESEAKEASKTEKEKFADRVKAIENELESTKTEKQAAILKGLAIRLLSDKEIKAPKYLDRLIGKDAEETEANITEFIEEQLERDLLAADKFVKGAGRTVQKTHNKDGMKLLEEYSGEEIKAMSDDEFLKVQERSKKETVRS